MEEKPTTIAVEFQQHTLSEYHKIHHKLNARYSGIIQGLDDIYKHANNPSAIPSAVTTKLAELMDFSDEDHTAKFITFCNTGAITLKWLAHDPETPC